MNPTFVVKQPASLDRRRKSKSSKLRAHLAFPFLGAGGAPNPRSRRRKAQTKSEIPLCSKLRLVLLLPRGVLTPFCPCSPSRPPGLLGRRRRDLPAPAPVRWAIPNSDLMSIWAEALHFRLWRLGVSSILRVFVPRWRRLRRWRGHRPRRSAGTPTRCSACPGTPPTRRSSPPTASSHSSRCPLFSHALVRVAMLC